MPEFRVESDFSHVNQIIRNVIRYEGGPVVTKDPDDRGGVTKFGITQKSWAHFARYVLKLPTARHDVTKISIDDAVAYYRNLFIMSQACMMPAPSIQMFYFDCCVHHGNRNGAKLLQRSCNHIIRIIDKPDEFAELSVDGAVGPKTLEATYRIYRSPQYKDMLLEMMYMSRLNFITRIVQLTPQQGKFYKGWKNRIEQCKTDALALDLE